MPVDWTTGTMNGAKYKPAAASQSACRLTFQVLGAEGKRWCGGDLYLKRRGSATMSKRQLNTKQMFAVQAWVAKNNALIVSDQSLKEIAIEAAIDTGFDVSPSSISTVLDAMGIVRPEKTRKNETIAGQLDRAEIDQLKRDVALIASWIRHLLYSTGETQGGNEMREVIERNK